MINWMFYPKDTKCPDHLVSIGKIFEKNEVKIASDGKLSCKLKSDEVLKAISKDLKQLGFLIEEGKTSMGKISRPVLFGEKGRASLSYDIDAYSEEYNTIVEVEAGQAVLNYKFLKDLIEACLIADSEYLVIAVKNQYKYKKNNKEQISLDYKKVTNYMDAIYGSQRITFLLKGIMIIGY